MIEEHICDMKHVKIHGNDFTDEIKYYLKMFSMTQKELSIRLGLSIKHINSIMNNEVNNVSATIIEALEYAFHLEIGTLTEVYHIYNNLKTLKKNKNIEDDLKKHGIDFLINHPELALAANISIHENSPLHVKLIMLKRFFGVADLANYDKYLKDNVSAEEWTYSNPNTKVWIRFCELLSIDKNIDENVGIFRKSSFNSLYHKVLTIMSNTHCSFEEKMETIKKVLLSKGINLVTMPFIENSLIRAIALKKGAKRYIFLSDMFNSEAYIFYSLLHEIVHCFFSNYTENKIDKVVIKEYFAWEKNNPTIYKAIYDAINSYQQCEAIQKANKNIDTSYIWSTLKDKYPYVAFDPLSDQKSKN